MPEPETADKAWSTCTQLEEPGATPYSVEIGAARPTPVAGEVGVDHLGVKASSPAATFRRLALTLI